METNLEIVKLKQQDIDGSKGWVISEEDFIRLISKHKLTLSQMRGLGISRSIWDNTLLFYGYNVNSIEGLRKAPWKESQHGNSSYGFSSVISIEDGVRPTDPKIKEYVQYLTKFFPNFETQYSTYHENSTELSKYMQDMSRELIELQTVLRYTHNRVRKWASRAGESYHKLFHNILNNSFAKLLDELQLEYKVEYKAGGYYFDFYVPNHKLFIEVDGGGHIYKRDKEKEKVISSLGKLLRFKVKDRLRLKQKYEDIRNTISKECGL